MQIKMSSVRESRSFLSRAQCEVGIKRKNGVESTAEGKENRNTCIKKQKLTGTPVKPPRSQTPAITSLQSQIEREYKIRDGAAKLLQASKSVKQSMEASKGLFVSDAKIISLMKELQHRQSRVGRRSDKSDSLMPCKAKIAISDIRVPLEWKEFETIKGKIDARYGVFCLFKMGNQVMDTSTLAEVDRSTMDIVFRDTIIFVDNVDPDFNLEVELYCSVPVEESTSKQSTPIKLFKKFRSKEKVEESPGVSGIPCSPYTPRISSTTPSHRFALAGYTNLTLKDVSSSCRTYVLKHGAVGSSGTASTGGNEEPLLPLWGQICCRLVAQPECATQLRLTGFINIQRMVGGLPDWKRVWCVMRQNHMRCWTSPEDVGKMLPVQSVELSQFMTVEPAPRLSMRRPNSLLLKDACSELFMAFESKEERIQWMSIINQAILDLKIWSTSCEFTIAVPRSKFYAKPPEESTTLQKFSSNSLII